MGSVEKLPKKKTYHKLLIRRDCRCSIVLLWNLLWRLACRYLVLVLLWLWQGGYRLLLGNLVDHLRILKRLVLRNHILSKHYITVRKLIILEVLWLGRGLLHLLNLCYGLVAILVGPYLVSLGLLGHELVLLGQILEALRPRFLVVWVHCL